MGWVGVLRLETFWGGYPVAERIACLFLFLLVVSWANSLVYMVEKKLLKFICLLFVLCFVVCLNKQ